MKLRNDLYYNCIKEFGTDSQILMLIEEMGELTHALSRELNKRENNVMEELADVSLMLEQVRRIYGVSAIEQIMDEKEEKILNIIEQRIRNRNDMLCPEVIPQYVPNDQEAFIFGGSTHDM